MTLAVHDLDPRRPRIMGILNVTPDSFSDGGRWVDAAAAIARGIELHEQGAHLVDVGGESTRPGAERIPDEEERARVLPVVSELVSQGVAVSVDTMNASTALAAAEAGASMINDVSGGLADPEMYDVIARTGVSYVAMHWRAHSDTMHESATYTDVVDEVSRELGARVDGLLAAGVSGDRIILDPGIGFAKTGEHNWTLLRALPQLQALGYPILVGASRKSFLAPFALDGAAPEARDTATAVISALAARSGAWGVRVHDVVATRVALEVTEAWERGGTT